MKILRDNLGRFMSPNKVNVVPGRLYALDNQVVVRAKKRCSNGYFLVSYHKDLYGFVRPARLSKISDKRVNRYLTEKGC